MKKITAEEIDDSKNHIAASSSSIDKYGEFSRAKFIRYNPDDDSYSYNPLMTLLPIADSV